MTDENALDPDALRLLIEVARLGSFTRAAERLNYTQSGVSRRVAELERGVGAPLFERLPRGVRLTPAGMALHGHAHAVLARLAEARRDLGAIRDGTAGRLRVGAFATAHAALLPAALRRFRAQRPRVEVIVREGLTGGLMADLESGEIDLAVVGDYPAGLPDAPWAELTHVRDDPFLVALPARHPAAGGARVTLVDLKDEQWIQAAPRGMPTRLSEACARAGFAPRMGPRIADWLGKFGYVAAGLGVTLVPSLAAHAVPSGVVLRELESPLPPRRIYVAMPGDGLSAGREFAALLAETGP